MNMSPPDDRSFSLQRGNGCWRPGSWSAEIRSRWTVKECSIRSGESYFDFSASAESKR